MSNFLTEAYKLKPTKSNLFLKGKQMGFKNDKDVIDTIRAAGLNGQFDPDHFEDYLAALLRERFARELLSDKKREEALKAKYNFNDDPCPVCGEKRIRREDRDRQFGNVFGWECTKSSSHFFEASLESIKPGMVGRTDRQQFGYDESDITRHDD